MKINGLTFLEAKIKIPLTSLPIRTTVVRAGDRTVVISPGSVFKREDYPANSVVTDVVAPNLVHHLGLRRAKELFPEANFWAAPGLEKKRSKFKFDMVFGKDKWPLEDQLPVVFVEGIPPVNEVVFYHKESRTLICTDLFFNLKDRKGFKEKILFKLLGTYNRFSVSRLVAISIKDREAFRKSIKLVLTWNFENIVMAHGDVLIGNGKNLAETALAERCLLN